MEIREKIPGYYLIFYFILIFVLAGLLSAVQILPIYEFTKHSVRTGPLSYRFATEFSFPLRHIITFLFPDFYGDMVTVPYWSGYYFWEMCAYSGIVTLFLVAVGLFLKKNKMAILFAGLGIFGLIFSFGGNTPLFKLLYNFLPGMRFLRGHSKFMFVVVMSMSILAGFGINNLLEELNERAKKRLIIILLLIFILLLIIIIYFVRLGSINDENWQELIIKTLQKEQNFFNKNHLKSESFFENAREQSLHSIYRTLVIVDISFVLFVILIVSKKLKGVSVVLLVLVLFGDLYSYNKKFLIGADESSFQLPKPIVDELKDNKQYFRIANSVFRLVNRPMQFSVYDACGYDSNILLRYAEYLNFIQDLPSGFQQFVAQIKRISPLLIQSFGIKYFILSPDVKLDSDAFQTIVKERDYQFVKLNIDVPRAVIFHNIVVAKDKEEARKFLLENKDKYFEKLVLEADLIDDIKNIKIPTKNDSSNNINEEQVEITDYSINSVSMKAKVNKEGYLFLSDVYYPGWKVKVDGKQERIYRANYLFRAVYLDKGEHNIEFYFQPSSFIIGAIISLLTIMSYISYFLYYHLKKI